MAAVRLRSHLLTVLVGLSFCLVAMPMLLQVAILSWRTSWMAWLLQEILMLVIYSTVAAPAPLSPIRIFERSARSRSEIGCF